MTHTEFKPHAFIALSNHGGIEIMLNRSNDGVYYRFNYGQDNLDQEEIFEAEIDYFDLDENGNIIDPVAGFRHNGEDIYFLNEAMRIS